MMTPADPPLPPDEEERLAALKRLDLLDTPAEERFDRITRLACRSMGTEMALVSLVDEDRQWFKSAQGLSARETDRDVAFCAHTIVGEESLVVEDATDDERFADNPLVTGEPSIRFYAGHPLHSPDGYRIGTLCVIDPRVRHPSEEDLQALQDLAALAENEIWSEALNASEKELRERLEEAERRASIDVLTQVWNRGVILDILHREAVRATRETMPLTAVMVDLDHFKRINDRFGHQPGDAVLAESASRIRSALRPYDSVGRYGGEEFLCVLTHCDRAEAQRVTERIRDRVGRREMGVSEEAAVLVTTSLGACWLAPGEAPPAPAELIEIADRALYRAKRRGRNRVEIDAYR